jgi:hypothetical protein
MEAFAIFHTISQAMCWKRYVEGRLEEVRRILLMVGRKRFGCPGKAVVAWVEGIIEVERPEALALEALHAESWQELLAADRRWECERALPSKPTWTGENPVTMGTSTSLTQLFTRTSRMIRTAILYELTSSHGNTTFMTAWCCQS